LAPRGPGIVAQAAAYLLGNLAIAMAELCDNIFLRGRKVLIRPFERADIDRRLKWKPYPDPLYSHYNLGDLSEPEKEAWFLKRKNDPSSVYLSIDNTQGSLIGFLRLYQIDVRNRSSWFGIYLGWEFLDQGLGTDATSTWLRYYFEELKYERLLLDVASLNTRAIRCYQKCRFEFIRSKYNVHDPRANIDVFGDESFSEVRKYFLKEGDRILVQFDEMEISREKWRRRRSGLSC
jgi:RimJ/RimL family protein N-acetyltransferase